MRACKPPDVACGFGCAVIDASPPSPPRPLPLMPMSPSCSISSSRAPDASSSRRPLWESSELDPTCPRLLLLPPTPHPAPPQPSPEKLPAAPIELPFRAPPPPPPPPPVPSPTGRAAGPLPPSNLRIDGGKGADIDGRRHRAIGGTYAGFLAMLLQSSKWRCIEGLFILGGQPLHLGPQIGSFHAS